MKYFKKLRVRHKVTAIGLAAVFALGFAAMATVNVSDAEAQEVTKDKTFPTDGSVTILKYYTTAAKFGSTSAMTRLGYMYYTGKGVEKNRETAYVWLTIASLKGHKKAVGAAALVILKLTPEQIKSADAKILKITKVRIRRVWF